MLTAFACTPTGDEFGRIAVSDVAGLVDHHPEDPRWYRITHRRGAAEDGATLYVSTRELGKLLFPARRAA